MHSRVRFTLLSLLLGTALTPTRGQDATGAPPQQQGADRMQGPRDGRGLGLFGKITAINKGAVELAKPDGSTTTIKLSDKTEFRKDRQGAKLEDFKVGDMVMVRTEGEGDSATAVMIAGRTGMGGGPGGGAGSGPGGGPSGGMMITGEMGKDFVVGEVKSINAPQITILRMDNVTQTIELTEETSLRKGRDSVTMADVQAGDHIFVRGALQNNVFVPKSVMVIGAEQWKRMQDMGMVPGGALGPAKAPADSKPNPQQR